MPWIIERLSDDHDVHRFRCGEYALDSFLKRHALANNRSGLGSTYVAVEDGARRVLGYVTLCANAVRFEHVPVPSLPHYPIPTLLIARLAVDRSCQGRGLGKELMVAALEIAVEIADRIGVFAVALDAMTDSAKSFYVNHFGFTELLDDPYHLFVTIADLRSSGIGG